MKQTNDYQQKIHLLPEHLIDQIKAGEVIERPSSVIKELVENAIDAKASQVQITLVANGIELISVEDDGHGMQYDDLPYAFSRHATSKIERFEDLYGLYTFGFRGEALASVSSISRLTCNSRPKGNTQGGGKIEIHGGQTKSHIQLGEGKPGTSIFVRDLFFNTPVRLKFIKSKQSEKNSLKRMIYSFILANPKVGFTFKYDEEEKEIFRATANSEQFKKRVEKVLFKKKKKEQDLLYIEGEYEGHSFKGHISVHGTKGNAGKQHFLFVNKRIFTDKTIHQIILRKSEAIWGTGMIGHYCLFLEVPPQSLDVNVHPNKTHVKFEKASLVFSLVGGAIEKAISSSGISAPVKSESPFPTPADPTFSGDLSPYQESPFQLEQTPVENDFLGVSPKESAIGAHWMGERHLLLPFENKWAMIHCHQLLKNLWQEEAFDPNALLPLLISEPFELTLSHTFNQHLETFKDWGFEFDRLDDKTLALRTIHHLWDGLAYREFLSALMAKDKGQSFSQLIELPWEMPFPPITRRRFENLLQKYKLTTLIEKNWVKLITLDDLDQWFNQL